MNMYRDYLRARSTIDAKFFKKKCIEAMGFVEGKKVV